MRTVSALQTGASSDAAEAERVLDECVLEVLAEGWHFNTRRNVELTPDDSDYLNLPSNAIMIDSDNSDKTLDVTQIGSRLYNNTDNTYEFDDSIKVTYLELTSFACCPYHVRNYIARLAAWRYALDKADKGLIGHNRLQDARNQYEMALSQAKRTDSRTSNFNVLTTIHNRRVRGDQSGVFR